MAVAAAFVRSKSSLHGRRQLVVVNPFNSYLLQYWYSAAVPPVLKERNAKIRHKF
jgi:hypothetical protein